jgi:hypothetical protein
VEGGSEFVSLKIFLVCKVASFKISRRGWRKSGQQDRSGALNINKEKKHKVKMKV